MRVYGVQIPAWQGENDWSEIRACDAETAAEEYTEQYEDDSAEYPVASGKAEIEVHVREPDGKIRMFMVSGECRPCYSACEFDGKEEDYPANEGG